MTEIWSAKDWLYTCEGRPIDDLGLTPNATDAEIDDAAGSVIQKAKRYNATITGDLKYEIIKILNQEHPEPWTADEWLLRERTFHAETALERVGLTPDSSETEIAQAIERETKHAETRGAVISDSIDKIIRYWHWVAQDKPYMPVYLKKYVPTL